LPEGNSLIDRTRRFELAALPHLRAAYNLARWLLRDANQAEDAVQDAFLNAFRRFDELRSESALPWLMAIVRNTCFDSMRRDRHFADQVEFDEVRDSGELAVDANTAASADPAAICERRECSDRVDAAIKSLPPLFREVIVLRELEEMTYQDVASVVGVPIGTVMSRLSRARALLRKALAMETAASANPGKKRDVNA
jgi:RNA polymerase sigma-70 factor (ECF subfamily)